MSDTSFMLQRRLRLGQMVLFLASIAAVVLVAGALSAHRPALAIIAAVMILGVFPLRTWLRQQREMLTTSSSAGSVAAGRNDRAG